MDRKQVKPIRLHLEIKYEYLLDHQKRMLKRYGESSTGDSISRDVLIPEDMPLHNLHYAIQKLFGWQNSHLRSFSLPKENFSKLTKNTAKGWSELVGILFQPFSEAEEDLYWDDNFRGGSINSWLKKKYKGPYSYDGYYEDYNHAQADVLQLLNSNKDIEVRETFSQYSERIDNNKELGKLRKASLIDLTIEEMHTSVAIEGDVESLIERLVVNEVLAYQNEEFKEDEIFPTSKEIIYNYDFGDNWEVIITKYDNCDDLLENNLIGKEDLEIAKKKVIREHAPVCIYKDGLSVLDDVGNLGGYADLLGVIYEGKDKEETSSAKAWAKSQGWSDKKLSNDKML